MSFWKFRKFAKQVYRIFLIKMDEEKFINYANPSGINPITVYQATKALECTDIRVAKKLENDLEQYFKKIIYNSEINCEYGKTQQHYI